MSGVPGYLFDALDRRFTVVQRVDYSPSGLRRLAVAARTFRTARSTWRARFHTSTCAHRALSKTLAERLGHVREPFDIALQVHGWVGAQPRPLVLYLDQTRLMAERGWPTWIPLLPRERSEILRLERDMYQRAAHLFVMGTPTRDSLISDYAIDDAHITVVGGGLNLDGLPAPHTPPTDPVVLFVGRDFERKGGPDLVQAFRVVRRELPRATLHLVGVGRKVDEPGVVCHGKLSDRRELIELYRTARAFCMPSRYEPWGLVFAEAMAYGVPCVGTTVQSIPHILGDGEAGLLVEPGDAEGLARALLVLLTDDAVSRRIGAAGRRLVEEVHTWDRVAERMATALLSASRAPAG
jgi:glycosyltransferase involved in cell wall biosynthesis